MPESPRPPSSSAIALGLDWKNQALGLTNSKADLAIEVTALRKQVNDLKEAAAARRRVEDALRSSDDLARATLEECPVPLCRINGGGRMLYGNRALAEFLRYESRREFVELVPVLGLFAEDTALSQIHDAVRELEASVDLICIFREKGGARREARVQVRSTQASHFTLAIAVPPGQPPD
jgi:PAS domain-containing protein